MGTHERRGPAVPHVRPPVAPPPELPPPVAPGRSEADPTSAYARVHEPSPAPSPSASRGPSPAPGGAPSGSSGLVPLRPGSTVPAATPEPVGFVPGAPVGSAAATRLRWDERGARRRASATTFGLTGRIVITVVVVLVVAVLSYGNVFGIPLFLAAAAWLLRDLWAKARVAPPRAPTAPAPRPSAFLAPASPSPAAPLPASPFPVSPFPALPPSMPGPVEGPR